MATRRETVDALLDLVGRDLRARAMFGEYALYWGDKVVALVCDDTVFLKPTEPGRARLPDAEEGPPYPGAKPHLIVDEDHWEDGHALAALFSATADALPEPKPKKPRKAAARTR